MTEREPSRPPVVVGWVLAAEIVDPDIRLAIEEAVARFRDLVASQFPDFRFETPFVSRKVFGPFGAIDPLPLLELGVQEKAHHGWDQALVFVPNELVARHRPFAMAVPSSALEVAVISTARLVPGPRLVDEITALVLHVFGHLLGLEHEALGPMRPPEDADELAPAPYGPAAADRLRERLEEIADVRLEDTGRRWGPLAFYWRTFRTDPGGIVRDVIGYAPWKMPLYLGRLTAASAVSTVFLLLTADAWEVGVHLDLRLLWGATVVALVASTVFIYVGQNVGQVGRETRWSEQTARARIVMFLTLTVGIVSLWFVLMAISLAATALVPTEVAAGWAGTSPDALPIGRYAVFVATIGVAAAALGGNLEDEDEIKAELLIDEET